jgi:DNA-binding XRE family transcriptional regulator
MKRQNGSSGPPLPALTGRDMRLIRQVRGVRQGDVARACGVSESKMSFIETGRDPVTPEIEVAFIRAMWPARDDPTGGLPRGTRVEAPRPAAGAGGAAR